MGCKSHYNLRMGERIRVFMNARYAYMHIYTLEIKACNLGNIFVFVANCNRLSQTKDKPKALKLDSIYNIDMLF